MAALLPHLHLEPGLTIGYTEPIAEAREPITLGPGNHFLLARNGRGKTTLLRTLASSLKRLGGEFACQGRLQYVAEHLHFDPELPVSSIFTALIPRARRDDALRLAERIELDPAKHYGQLSTGNRRKTHLIVAEFSLDPSKPGILLLDEPLSGLDAHARAAFEHIWKHTTERVLRLVSCHPDYDSMPMTSALIIRDGLITHSSCDSQTWQQLKHQLN